MCAPKAPKISAKDSKPPDPAIIRNPYFDGALDFQQARMGRNSLRIDPGTTRGIRIPTPQPAVPAGPAPAPGSRLRNRLLSMPENPGGFAGMLWTMARDGVPKR